MWKRRWKIVRIKGHGHYRENSVFQTQQSWYQACTGSNQTVQLFLNRSYLQLTTVHKEKSASPRESLGIQITLKGQPYVQQQMSTQNELKGIFGLVFCFVLFLVGFFVVCLFCLILLCLGIYFLTILVFCLYIMVSNFEFLRCVGACTHVCVFVCAFLLLLVSFWLACFLLFSLFVFLFVCFLERERYRLGKVGSWRVWEERREGKQWSEYIVQKQLYFRFKERERKSAWRGRGGEGRARHWLPLYPHGHTLFYYLKGIFQNNQFFF